MDHFALGIKRDQKKSVGTLSYGLRDSGCSGDFVLRPRLLLRRRSVIPLMPDFRLSLRPLLWLEPARPNSGGGEPALPIDGDRAFGTGGGGGGTMGGTSNTISSLSMSLSRTISITPTLLLLLSELDSASIR